MATLAQIYGKARDSVAENLLGLDTAKTNPGLITLGALLNGDFDTAGKVTRLRFNNVLDNGKNPEYLAEFPDTQDIDPVSAALAFGPGAMLSTKVHGGALRSGKLSDLKASGEKMTLDKLIDGSRAVSDRRNMVREAMAKPVDIWTPNDRSSYFDRSLIKEAMNGHPGVPQTPIERISPTKRTNLAPAENLFSKDNVELIKMQIDRGNKMGGQTYYPSTYPIRARYEELNGPITFKDFVRANAATSPQAALPVNIPSATLLMYMKKRGIPTTWENVDMMAKDIKQRYGSGYFLGPSHVDNFNNAEAGLLTGFEDGQKIASYGTNLEGNFRPYTIDTHETKGMSQGTAYFPYFDKQKGVNSREYGAIENQAQRIAESLGLPPANAQAARWFGGGELTGLRSPRGDYLNTLEDLIKFNAEKRGWDTSRPAMQGKINEVLSGDEFLVPYWRRTPTIEYNTSLFE